MSQNFSWARAGIIALVVAVVGGGVAAGIYFFYNTTERALLAGEKSYNAGEGLLDDDPAAAANRFEEAALQASKVLDAVAKDRGANVKSKEEANRLAYLEARACWLKARALRDRAYAAAAADGKPIKENEDTTFGGTFRSVLAIPDQKERDEAFGCLRLAALRLTEAKDIQHEALRAEIMLPATNWRLVEQFSKQLLELDESNTRALQQLALYHYEQPAIDSKGRQGPPPPLARRQAARMREAREYVARAQKTKDAKYWRLAELDAKITLWMRDHGAEGKDDARRKEAGRLKQLLGEALTRAEDEKAIQGLPVFDVRSLLGLHLMALREQAATALKDKGAASRTASLLDRVLSLGERLGPKGTGRDVLEACALAALDALTLARPSAPQKPGFWDARLGRGLALASAARDAGAFRPELFAQVVRLEGLEAQLAHKKGDAAREKKHNAAAEEWLKEGLARGKKAKLSPQQMGDLHLLAAERLSSRLPAPGKLEEHLAVLRQHGSAQAKALAYSLEGASLRRQGRLARAARAFELAEKAGANPAQTNAALASLYLSLGQPDKALSRLQRVLQSYKQLESMTEQEQAWALEFISAREDLQLQLVVAGLDTALRRAAEAVARRRPDESIKELEANARKVIEELPPASSQARSARMALVQFLARLGRREDAVKELAAFEKLFRDDLGAIQLRAMLTMALPPGEKPDAEKTKKRRAEVDALIQGRLKSHPDDLGGKLFWASWLSRTGRADQAVKYLKEPANFPGPRGEDYKRVLALALVGSGDRAGGAEVLRQLPPSPTIDFDLIRLAGSLSDRKKKLDEALQRHERDGLLRCLAGSMQLEKGEPAQAAESFFKALEYTQARGMAEQGLLQSLFAHAGKSPARARDQIARMLKEAPEEKALYLAYAYAALMLDDIGQPTQSWEAVRTMASALRQWENAYLREAGQRGVAPLTRAAFWLEANRPDLALAEARRALQERPGSPQALALAAELAMGQGGAGLLAEADKWIEALSKAAPGSPQAAALRARWLALDGKKGEAIKALREALKKSPDAEILHGLLVSLLLEEKDAVAAEAAAREWAARSPAAFQARARAVQALAARGKPAEAAELATKYHGEWMKRWDEKAAKRKAPDGTKPADWAKQVSKLREQEAQSRELDLADALHLGKAFDDAAKLVKQVLTANPKHERALVAAGQMALGRGDWKAAREAYEKLLQVSPGHGVAANNLAWLLAEKANDVKKAEGLVTPMLKGRHSGKPLPGGRIHPDALDTVALVYLKLGDQAKLERLRLLLKEGRERYPNDPRLALHLADAYAALESPQQAREMYQTAARLAKLEAPGLDAAQRADLARKAQEGLNKLPAGN